MLFNCHYYYAPNHFETAITVREGMLRRPDGGGGRLPILPGKCVSTHWGVKVSMGKRASALGTGLTFQWKYKMCPTVIHCWK